MIDSLERAQLRRVPVFQAGDRVRVHFQVVEGTRRRTQVFEGIVIRRHGTGVRETFTVRKHSFGVGVERTFPLHSPKIEKIEVAARGDVRRAKLYYLRERVGRRARVRERRWTGAEEVAYQAGAMPPDDAPRPGEEELAAAAGSGDGQTPEAGAEQGAAAGGEQAEQPAGQPVSEPVSDRADHAGDRADAAPEDEPGEQAPNGGDAEGLARAADSEESPPGVESPAEGGDEAEGGERAERAAEGVRE